MSYRIPLARPALGEREIASVRAVLESGQLTRSPVVEEFEAALGQVAGTRHAVAVSSGTAALHLLLLSLDLQAGDEVVVPAYTFPATASAVVHARGRPVFCDVDERSGVATLDHVRAVTGRRTRGIIAVHLFGYPMGVGAIQEFANHRGIPLLVDAAGALGTLVEDRPATASGFGAALSFHPRKLVTTGEGGAIVTDDAELAARCRRLRHHGLDDRGRLVEPGLNYRLSSIQAAMGIPQLERLDENLRNRERLAHAYDQLLADSPVRPAPRPRRAGDRHAWQAYVAQAPEPLRDRIINRLRRSGVEAQVGTYIVSDCRAYAGNGDPVRDHPGAHRRAAGDLALPFFEGLTREELQEVTSLLARAAEEP